MNWVVLVCTKTAPRALCCIRWRIQCSHPVSAILFGLLQAAVYVLTFCLVTSPNDFSKPRKYSKMLEGSQRRTFNRIAIWKIDSMKGVQHYATFEGFCRPFEQVEIELIQAKTMFTQIRAFTSRQVIIHTFMTKWTNHSKRPKYLYYSHAINRVPSKGGEVGVHLQ